MNIQVQINQHKLVRRMTVSHDGGGQAGSPEGRRGGRRNLASCCQDPRSGGGRRPRAEVSDDLQL